MEHITKKPYWKQISDMFAATSVLAVIILHQKYLQHYRDELLIQQTLLNNTIVSNQSYVVFNRVPKAGSEMLWSLIDRLAQENNFTSYSDSMKVKNKRGSENTFLKTKEDRKYYVDLWVNRGSVDVENEEKPNFIKGMYILLPGHYNS